MPRREKQAGRGDGGREAGAAPFTARDPRRGWHTPVDNRVGAGGPQDPECKCVRISRCRARSAALPISPQTLLFPVSFPSQLNFVLGAARALHALRALADAHLPPSPQRRCVSSAAPSRHGQKPGASQSPCSTTAPARGSRALPLTGLVSLPPPLVLASAHSQATTDSLRNLDRVPGLLCCDPAGGFW